MDTPGYARGVAIIENNAYVADYGSGLQVIDISDPSNPAIIGSVDTPGSACAVAVTGNKAYVADYESGLQVIDISDPSNPAIIGSVDTPGYAYGVAVTGDKAYVADSGSGLQVIDISDPSNPAIISSVDTPGYANGVAITGDKAYVADSESGLQIIDISDPSNPTIIGSMDMPGYASGVAVTVDRAYMVFTGWMESYLHVIDIGDPFPTIIASVDTPGYANGVAITGDKAYVVDNDSGLQVIDISDPSNPAIIGSVDTPGYAYGVAVTGDKAYVADSGSGLQVIDISDPTNPAIIGSVDTSIYVSGVTIRGNKAYVVNDGGLQIIDINDPSNPTIIGSVDTPSSAYGMAVTGDRAYVVTSEYFKYKIDFESGLQVIDISNPSNPAIIGSVNTPGSAYGVAVAGDKAYVTGGDGLFIFSLPIEILPVTVNNDTSISFTIPAPPIAGNYILRVFNANESDEAFISFIFDSDTDGIPDNIDNCPNTYNPDQEDADKNGVGDECEFTFVHLTDIHIGYYPNSAEMEESVKRFTDTLQSIKRHKIHNPDFMLVTGDLVEYSNPYFFNAYKEILKSINIPVYNIPGNHDTRAGLPPFQYVGIENYRDIIKPINGPDPNPISLYNNPDPDNDMVDYYFDFRGYRFIGLNSGGDESCRNPKGTPEGTGLEEYQYNRLLESDMKDYHRKIIFMHHPVINFENDDGPTDFTIFPISNKCSDYGGNDACIASYRCSFIKYCIEHGVDLVLTGHTHKDYFAEISNESETHKTWFIQTRSATDDKNSFNNHGYRVIKLKDDGKIKGITPYMSELTESLEGHTFTLSKRETMMLPPGLIFGLSAKDQDDRHTGMNQFGAIEREIPDSYYTGIYDGTRLIPQVLVLYNNKPKEVYFHSIKKYVSLAHSHIVQESATSSQEIYYFDFTINHYTQNETIKYHYENIDLTEYSNASVNLASEHPDYIMKIDENGDGVPEKEKEPTIEIIRACVDPFDADTDDDGISDGAEDVNKNGVVDLGETDPCSIDTDGDGIQDGTELGITAPVPDPDGDGNGPLLGTDTNVFIADADPDTTTDPLNNDSDDDGAWDGTEDANHNGMVDPGETDPNNISSNPSTLIHLKQEFNLIAIPADVTNQSDLKDWLPVLGDNTEIEKVMVYDGQAGKFVTLIPGNPSNESFTLNGGEGLIVYAKQDKEITFTSVLCATPDLKLCFNLVGFACPADGYSAYQLLNDLGSENVSSIQRYSTEKGAFETAGFRPDGQLAGLDFSIVAGEGYFIYRK